MPTPINEDSVEYAIYIQAIEAIKSLKELSTQATTFSQKIEIAKAKANEFSRQFGMTTTQSAKRLGEIDQTFKTFGSDTDRVWKEVGKGAVDAGSKTNDAGSKMEAGMNRATRAINVVRLALGVLVSMLIFNLIAAIQNTFRTMIDNLKEAETAMFNLINAEQKLSEQGIDITPKGLDELIQKLQEINPLLTQIQAEELVSSIATKVAPALGLGQKEIESLSVSVALLSVRNMAMGKSFDEVMSQVETGLLSGKVTQGINQLGAKITELAVKEKAVELNLIETKDAYNDLDAAQKEHITALSIIAILEENRNKELENLPKFLQTATAEIGEANKQWNDFLTILGKAFGPIIGQGFEVIAQALRTVIALLEAGLPIIQRWVALTVALVDTMRNIPQYFKLGGGADLLKNFKENFDAVMESFKGLDEIADTPTVITPEVDTGEALANLEELKDKIEDIISDTADAREDLSENLSRKLNDLDEEYRRKANDAEVDFLRKQEDINRDYERDVADLRRRHREEDEKDEAKYQLALWELRQKFLMDLDDALHARDARQVLRLQKQYALDKEALRRKHELEGREREQGQRTELEDLEQRRQERLADARLEYEQKLADLRIAKQREQEDLQKWYEREQADIELAMQRKLETLIKGWMDEKKITEANAAEVYGILLKYFGPGGLTDSLYQYMMSSMIASTQGAITAAMGAMGSIGGGIGGGGHTVPLASQTAISNLTNQGTVGGRNMGFAEGGSLLATRPTKAVFGEGGPELVNFTPLNRIGKNINKIFGDASGMGGGVNGQIKIAVDLSPDLEGRIVEQSMNGVADVLTRVSKTK